MLHSILNGLQPRKELKNITFLKETCEQINKDLIGFTVKKIELTADLLDDPMDDLVKQFQSILETLEESNSLQSFIYKVDLPEKKYINYKIKNTTEVQFLEGIIERCAQKVYLRWYFSNPLNR